MAHYAPKIVYGPLSTTFSFPYPPLGLPEPEQDDAAEHVLTSLSGLRQVQVDFLEVSRKLKFGGLSEAEIASLRTWFRTWAYLGKQFRFYEDQNGTDYDTYELADLKFKPKRTGVAGANAYTYTVEITMRRVESEDLVDYREFTIANNQASATSITGFTLDSSSYKSVRILYELRRKTDSSELVENGALTAIYKDSTASWDITAEGTSEGDDAGVTFSMVGSQVKYTSTNQSGSNYTGTMRIKEVTF